MDYAAHLFLWGNFKEFWAKVYVCAMYEFCKPSYVNVTVSGVSVLFAPPIAFAFAFNAKIASIQHVFYAVKVRKNGYGKTIQLQMFFQCKWPKALFLKYGVDFFWSNVPGKRF